MAKYRKKPVDIDAVQWKGINSNELIKFAGSKIYFAEDNVLQVSTLEGTSTAKVGDWIIKGIQGELYPCKPDIFEQTYEKVDDGGAA